MSCLSFLINYNSFVCNRFIYGINSNCFYLILLCCAQSCPTLCDPMDCSSSTYQAPLSMWFSRPECWSGLQFPYPGDLPNPVIEPRSPTLQADSLQAEPQGKPRNTGLGSLSLLHWIFQTQESSLHCRWILYQLSYQGGPPWQIGDTKNRIYATVTNRLRCTGLVGTEV